MMKKYIFSYTVGWYEERKNGELSVNVGVTYADTFAEAMENVARHYGDETIEECQLRCISEGWTCLELPQTVINNIEEKAW